MCTMHVYACENNCKGKGEELQNSSVRKERRHFCFYLTSLRLGIGSEILCPLQPPKGLPLLSAGTEPAANNSLYNNLKARLKQVRVGEIGQ